MRPTVGSLFSGIGGFDLGLERAGMRIAWQCEIDERARSVLCRHWPEATLHEDITEMKGSDGGAAVDIICGGFPCQDLSVAGGRAGLAGKRSGLFFEFMRVVAERAPRWVLIENVPGLLSSNGRRDMGTVLGTLGELGYGWAYRVLDAQYFGVAQSRRRVFIVGCFGDPRAAAEVLFEPESCSGDSPPRRDTKSRPAGSPESSSGDLSKCLMAKSNDSQDPTMQTYLMVSRSSNPAIYQECMGVRRLTPLECERLQGFPDGWTAGQNDSIRYKQLGNAVCVPVAEWVGERMMQQVNGGRR